MKKRLTRIIISGILFILAIIIKVDISFVTPALYISCFLVVGWDVVYKAFRNILRGKVFDENFGEIGKLAEKILGIYGLADEKKKSNLIEEEVEEIKN